MVARVLLAGSVLISSLLVHGGSAQAAYDRIISLYGAHTENLLALGGGDRLAGIDRHSVDLPGVQPTPVFSYHDDPERFLAARPDLVLICPMIQRGYPRLIQRLETSAIRVVSIQPTAVDQLPEYWRLLGELAGRTASAERMIRRFDTAVRAFQGLAQQVASPKRVFFEAIHNRMKTISPTAMAIFAPKMGLQLLLLGQGLRVASLIVVGVGYYWFF